MPRPLPVITAETIPLEVLDDGDALRYVRATELLRLARARREARLKTETSVEEKIAPVPKARRACPDGQYDCYSTVIVPCPSTLLKG